jgi:hypothetical protein
LAGLAIGAPAVIDCIENSIDGTAEELSQARQDFLDFTDEHLEELTANPENAAIGLKLLLIALGRSNRFGQPADLPLTEENVISISILFAKTALAFQASPASSFQGDNIYDMFVVISEVAEYILTYYLELAGLNNQQLREISQELSTNEFLYYFNIWLDSIATNVQVDEGIVFYEDANLGIHVQKVPVPKVVGSYRATKENAGSVAYISRPVREYLNTLPLEGEVGVVVVHWKKNLHGNDSDTGIVGGFLAVRLVSENQALEISELEVPSAVGLSVPAFDDSHLPICVYWNETTYTWEEDGVALYNEAYQLISCTTTHFTDFAVATVFVDCAGEIEGVKEVDECGICGGDGTTCCSNYLGVDNKVWDFVLLPVAVCDIIERLHSTRDVLEYVYDNIPEEDELTVELQWGDVAEINNLFNDECITPFCGISKDFLGDLLGELRTEYPL